MTVTIKAHTQRMFDKVVSSLEDDGWDVQTNQTTITCKHRDVRDESAARNRLYELGLLTSASVSIRFTRELCKVG